MDAVKFDLELFKRLNLEYASKPIVPVPPDGRIEQRTQQRARRLDRLFNLRNKRLLDVGCGKGEVALELVRNYDCKVLAVDIMAYPNWSTQSHPGLEYRVLDLSGSHGLSSRSFDLIYSWSVMEHVVHPFSMLRSCRDLLTPKGRFFMVAHLYRSATGSHRSREIYFPWPHLLFTDDVFEQYYRSTGLPVKRPAWLNRLTHADYFRYFELLGYVVEEEFIRTRELDVAFYERFSEELSKYSVFDLTTNAVEVVLSVDRRVKRYSRRSNRLVRRSAIGKNPVQGSPVQGSPVQGSPVQGRLNRAMGLVRGIRKKLETRTRGLLGSRRSRSTSK